MEGFSLIGQTSTPRGRNVFTATNPASGESLAPNFHTATPAEIEEACAAALASFRTYSALSGTERARLLEAIADQLTSRAEEIIARANLETGLPLPRLQGELGRTTGQLRLFAELVREGSWADARIDEAMPDRKPLPRADIRSVLRPLGPVAVFGASNFPLAFSVAGGDTASALAAGNTVVVKAHPAHPGTSEIAGHAIQAAVAECGLPSGVFSLLFDSGIEVGEKLVLHPAIKAVCFTGSSAGGKALMNLANSRPEPIPCYAEMGSTNPLFILPGAMKERAAQLATGLQASFTLGSGQFCTKPGLVFMPTESDAFTSALKDGVAATNPMGMLTPGIAAKYDQGLQGRSANLQPVAAGTTSATAPTAAGLPTLYSVSLNDFLAKHELEEEIFGPTTLLIHYGSPAELAAVAEKLHGHLTATIHGTTEDFASASELIEVLSQKVGRILCNGYPTGVEVCHAMVHGGPFPSTSDGRSSSVGTRAIMRLVRPVCYQDFPDEALPAELQRANPLGILRMVNGSYTR